MNRMHTSLAVISLFLASVPSALANTTWYVNGATGTDVDDCLSNTTPCKTIGHTVSLALSGDSILVDAATYAENLIVDKNLNILGSSAGTTIIDGGGIGTVVTISSTTAVILSGLTIRNGSAAKGGGIYNSGTLTLSSILVSANHATIAGGSALGGGIYNAGALTINNSTISGNGAAAFGLLEYAYGGGIANNGGTLTISNTTINGNSASLGSRGNVNGRAYGGGIANLAASLRLTTALLVGTMSLAPFTPHTRTAAPFPMAAR